MGGRCLPAYVICIHGYLLCYLAEEEGEEDDESSGDAALQYNRLTMPEIIISLNATDEFLKERVMNLPQVEVEGTHNTEEG